ncbi:hypothetical protein TNIN_236731 [Trichonephila inaurata madagascariensis]|uniref:Uncharacterized protein n=1 Tax=Trichonephila inaurata madagascariensis TaxID=2747483 RepID=A0A8X6ID08_9ARAC|nr:hypothetical protein TNIN_236731 [Trichonephila inaurata madagascariensis]
MERWWQVAITFDEDFFKHRFVDDVMITASPIMPISVYVNNRTIGEGLHKSISDDRDELYLNERMYLNSTRHVIYFTMPRFQKSFPPQNESSMELRYKLNT